MIYQAVRAEEPLTQGDIIERCPIFGVDEVADAFAPDAQPVRWFVRVIVLTQSCDLAHAKTSKVLVAVVHDAAELVLRNNPVTDFTFQGAHTLPWAPPEQIEGAPAHPFADIYPFGRVMSFLLTGSQDKSSIQKVPEHWVETLRPCIDVSAEKRPELDFVRSGIEQLSI